MKSKFPLVTAAVVALCGGVTSDARAGVEDHVTFSGFGTLGGVVTNNDDVDFRRDQQPDGANQTIDTGVDTDIGVQLSVQANSWLSATVQGLALKRYDHEKNMEIEWAFLKATPLPGLSVRAGRMAMSTFLVSDSRNVGYANTWLRAPNEVYGLALLPRIEGGDVTYTKEVGKVRLTGSFTAGHSEANVVGQSIAMKDVHGLNLQMQMGAVTARAGRVTAHAEAPGIDDIYSFNSIGVSYDKDKVLAQAEYVQRRSDNFYNTVAADGWYAMGGYRFGAFTPYAMVARTTPQHSDSEVPSPIGTTISGKQNSLAAGVRWDATSFAAVKFQFDRVKADGTNGISFTKSGPSMVPGLPNDLFVSVDTVNVFSATVDFVF